MRPMRASGEQRRELVAETTRLLRAADRRERAVVERAPPPKARPLPPAWPDHLRFVRFGMGDEVPAHARCEAEWLT
jgi:hypothetical protein